MYCFFELLIQRLVTNKRKSTKQLHNIHIGLKYYQRIMWTRVCIILSVTNTTLSLWFSLLWLSQGPCSQVRISLLRLYSQWLLRGLQIVRIGLSPILLVLLSIVCVSLGALSRFWHLPKDVIISCMDPPLLLSTYFCMQPPLWRLFWSLPLSAKAFITWWRLLHNRIGRRS